MFLFSGTKIIVFTHRESIARLISIVILFRYDFGSKAEIIFQFFFFKYTLCRVVLHRYDTSVHLFFFFEETVEIKIE